MTPYDLRALGSPRPARKPLPHSAKMAMSFRASTASQQVSARKGCRSAAARAPFSGRRAPLRVVADAAAPAAAADAAKAAGTEKTGPNFKPLREINQIMQTLPHR